MGILRDLLRAAVAPDALAASRHDAVQPQPPAVQLAREPGQHKLGDLTLERHHAAIASDLSVLRGDLHNIAEDLRVANQRAEQVYSWLAHLQTDLHRALRGEVSAVVEGLAAKRILTQRGAGVPLVNRPDGGIVHPLMHDTDTDGQEP